MAAFIQWIHGCGGEGACLFSLSITLIAFSSNLKLAGVNKLGALKDPNRIKDDKNNMIKI